MGFCRGERLKVPGLILVKFCVSKRGPAGVAVWVD